MNIPKQATYRFWVLLDGLHATNSTKETLGTKETLVSYSPWFPVREDTQSARRTPESNDAPGVDRKDNNSTRPSGSGT